MDPLNTTFMEYFLLTDLTVDEQTQFLSTHADDVVEDAAKQSVVLADAFFIAAVGSAGTHIHIVRDVVLDSVPPIFVKRIGELLRYAKAICDASGSEMQYRAPVAFVFSVVRRMCAVGFKNLELYLSLSNRFEELITRLRRMDGYLQVPYRANIDTKALISALVDIVRLCGQVTKFMEENSLPRIGNDTFDSFLSNLERVKIDEISSDMASEEPRIPSPESLFESECRPLRDGSGFQNVPVSNSLQLMMHQTFPNSEHNIKDTGHWFLKSPQFQSWVEGDVSPYLWVRGLPGTGKTVLAAKAIEALHRYYSGICTFFFCSERESSKCSASSIVETIINQLAQQCLDIAEPLSHMRREGFSFTFSSSLIWRHVVEQIAPTSKRLYVVLDGLDECDADERRILLDIVTSSKQNLNISWLIFSRFLPDIAQSLNGPNMIIKPTDSIQDIRNYTEELVDHSPILHSVTVRTEVVERISRGAGGLFLWAKLMVQLLEKEENVSSVLGAIHSLHPGMKSLCDRICQSLDRCLSADYTDIISRAFEWVACASRPLTIIELSEAIRFSCQERALGLESVLRNCCGDLISVSSSLKVVGFIHRTIEEYLASDCCVTSLAVNYRDAHAKASNVCFLYLSNEAFAKRLSSARVQTIEMALLNKQYPLLSYSALSWPEHVDYAKAEMNPEIMRQLSDFISSKNLLTAIEVALAIDGIASLHRWMQALSNLDRGLQDSSQYENVKRFIFDFQRLIRHYGPILDQSPSQIHYLIDESFPRNSHFWKYFGRPVIPSVNGQSEEWDSLIVTLKQRHITCTVVSAGYIAAADETGVSIWDLRSYTEIFRISNLPSLVVALAFNEDDLAILCQDGSLNFFSTQLWMIKRTLDKIITLPTVLRGWSGTQFWSTDFCKFDPVHINLRYVGKGILASIWLINLENGKKRPVTQTPSSSTIPQLACTKSGDLVTFTANGDAVTRRLGSPKSPVGHFKHTSDGQGSEISTKRLLAVSTTGRFIATCGVTVLNSRSRSENVFECLGWNLETSILIEQFGIGDKITTAAFSADESMLAVSSHNAETLADTTRIWTLREKPQLVWEKILYDDYTTTLHFGMEDTVLVKAGRFLRVWDVSERMCRFTFRQRMATNLGDDGKGVTSVTIEESILSRATDGSIASTETPSHHCLRHRNSISRAGIRLLEWCTHLLVPRSQLPRESRSRWC